MLVLIPKDKQSTQQVGLDQIKKIAYPNSHVANLMNFQGETAHLFFFQKEAL